MRTPASTAFASLIGVGLMLISGLTFAAAGAVEFATGDARISRNGTDVRATKDGLVESGDALITGTDGRMRVRMQDGEQIALHPNTRFVIDQYTPATSSSRPETGQSFYSLVRGGFDAVVTSLGRRDTSSYRVKTPVATMGIRGTAYTAVWTPQGFYVNVTEGAVTVTNAAGTLTVAAGQTGFVGLGGAAPSLVSGIPAAGSTTVSTTVATSGSGAGVGVIVPLAILGGIGVLGAIVGNDSDSSEDTDTTTTTTTGP